MAAPSKHITTRRVAADPGENVIIVEYSERGSSATTFQKIVLGDHLHQLNDVEALAKKIMRKFECIINEDWLEDVEDAIIELCNRADANFSQSSHEEDTVSISSDHVNEVIDQALQLLYGTDNEKQFGVNSILALCQDLSALEYLVRNHQLMNALTRLFGGEDLLTELSFTIGKLFLAFSLVEDFHEILSNYRVGALALGVVELEVKRACHRGKAPAAANSSDLASPSYSYSFSKKQERVVMVCCRILIHVADDFSALCKMVKKSIATTLGHCLEMKSTQALKSVLCLMMKASIFEDAAVELSSGEQRVVQKLASLLRISSINDDVAFILFNLSFHNECADLMSFENSHSPIIKMLSSKSRQSNGCKLAYNLSCNKDNMRKFVAAGAASKLIDLLKNMSPREPFQESAAGLLVNMTLDPLCAEEMAVSGVIGITLSNIEKTSDIENNQVLLKVLRNLSDWSRELQRKLHQMMTTRDDSRRRHTSVLEGFVKLASSYISPTHSHAVIYWDHHFWDAHVDFIMQSVLNCKDDNLLVEWIAILANMTKDDMPAGLQWHDLLDDNNSKILRLCNRILDADESHKRYDDLKLEVVIWLGELCTSNDCSNWIASSNLIAAMHDELIQCTSHQNGSEEMMLQILLSYRQFLMYEETRFQVIAGDGILDAILSCLSKGSVLTTAAEECLVLLEDLDRDKDGALGNLGKEIQLYRFEQLFYNSWGTKAKVSPLLMRQP